MTYNLAVPVCELHEVFVWMAFHVTFAEDFGVQPREMGGACTRVVSFNSSLASIYGTIPIRAYMALWSSMYAPVGFARPLVTLIWDARTNDSTIEARLSPWQLLTPMYSLCKGQPSETNLLHLQLCFAQQRCAHE